MELSELVLRLQDTDGIVVEERTFRIDEIAADGREIELSLTPLEGGRPTHKPSLLRSHDPFDPELGDWALAGFGSAADPTEFLRRVRLGEIDRAGLATRVGTSRVPDVVDVLQELRECVLTGRQHLGSSLIALVGWAEGGFQRVQMPHALAAGLIATSIGGEALETVNPPWPHFVIDVPDNLVCITRDGAQQAVRRVLVSYAGGLWTFFATTDFEVFFQLQRRAEELVRTAEAEDHLNHALSCHLEQEQRLLAVLGRLVINTCAVMDDPTTEVKQRGNGHAHWERRREGKHPGPIGPRLYRLVRPVKIDARQAIQDYLGGTRKSVSLQTLVRGHMRNQAHGPRYSLRKKRWIEPHWRGPEDAPIALRPHIVA